MLIGEDVRIRLFFEVRFTTGINKLGGGIGFVLGEHENIHGDGGAKKQVGCEGNFVAASTHHSTPHAFPRECVGTRKNEKNTLAASFAELEKATNHFYG